MTTTETNYFRSVLEAKHAEVIGSLRHRDEIAIEKASELLDQLQMAGDRELAISSLARNSNMAQLIRNALKRIADGSYGICVHCEEAISPKRMRALPWASTCIECQEQLDRHARAVESKPFLLNSALQFD